MRLRGLPKNSGQLWEWNGAHRLRADSGSFYYATIPTCQNWVLQPRFTLVQAPVELLMTNNWTLRGHRQDTEGTGGSLNSQPELLSTLVTSHMRVVQLKLNEKFSSSTALATV